ncbi:diguanylate cyclase [Cohnella sp. CFH 77786]|uniref:GGDEF domain-containing protein n=1 Tax=Cohnella sp. CFH 77786 TaxID=2662265 RepID=UPI001C60E10D|nr:diguanylate cyclase [Cohnella sp. CFH 77786]MBW5449300.1 diguanylate cyclase [Cohnella sp. CFH 77786]
MLLARDLISNFALLSTMIFIVTQISSQPLLRTSGSAKRKWAIGVVFGLIGICQILLSIRVTPSMMMDLRSLAIVCASLFEGLPAAVLASLIIAAARLTLFGALTDAAVSSSISIVVNAIGCGIIVHIVKDYRKAWACLLLYSAALPAINVYWLLRENSRPVIFAFVPIYLASGVLIAYVIYYLDRTKALFLKYETEATKDHLTGLPNVRSFDVSYNEAVRQANVRHSALSVLMVDIDDFKMVNDTYGHAAGDEILKQFAAVLADCTGSPQSVFRKGGEEYAVILENCPRSHALTVADAICAEVRRFHFRLPDGQSIPITTSIGTASYPDIAGENLLAAADAALYEAKRTGRNKAVSASGTARMNVFGP